MSISDNKCKNYSYMASDLGFPRLVQVTAAPLDDACGSMCDLGFEEFDESNDC